MSAEEQQIQTAIAALEARRALLGDAVVDATLGALHARLAALTKPAAAEPAQTLKQVTILFLDVVGSTALSQRLDPEEIHAVMDDALARCTAIVESHKGKVLQYAGDSLLAVFGADQSSEDDAERAVHAGLALLAEGRARAKQVAQQHGHADFNVRVGLHTGRVLLGGGVDAEHSIRGTTVHIAARMEQTAPAGGLRISHDTYRHVRGVFDVEAQAPIPIKGVDEPMATYLVQRAKPRAFRVVTRGIEGVETCMIGRDAELAQLQSTFARLYRGAGFLAVTVAAEAGLGKSRLLYEFQNWAEAQPEVFCLFQGRALPQTQSQPYGLLRDMLAWRLQIGDGDSMDVAKKKFEQGIAPLFERDDGPDMAQAHAHVLGHLIGLDFAQSKHVKGIKDDARQIRTRGFHAAAQMLRRIAEQHSMPIVLLLDDLHYADDSSLDFLDYLAQTDCDVCILLLGLTRPSLFERRAPPTGSAPTQQRIDLGPLDRHHSRALANELLKRLDAIPNALHELIIGGAEGNPFYMEELVKMLVDEGAISTGPEQWTVNPDKLVAAHVPQTLTGVLQARLDGLKPGEKLALQQASVIGFVFWDQALVAINPKAHAALAALSKRELVIPRPDTTLAGVREYVFKHQILHHVTYDSVLKHVRRDGHAKAAAWLAELGGARANDFLGATADHYAKAGDNRQACEYFARAAEHARNRYAHEAALDSVARALDLMNEDGDRAASAPPHDTPTLEMRWRLFDVRERTLDLQGKRSEQHADIAVLEELADALDDDRRRAEVSWRRGDIALRMADYRTGEIAIRQSMAHATRAADAMLRLRAQLRLAVALSYLGDAVAGKAMAHEGLAEARALKLRLIESLFLNALTIVASVQDDLVLGLESGMQKLPIDRELGNARNEAATLNNLGNSLLCLGEHAQAKRHLEESLRLSRAVGDRFTQTYPLNNLSVLALRQGDDAAAQAHAKAALEIAVDVQNRESEAHAQVLLGNAELALGHLGDAAAAFERAHEVALAIDNAERHAAAAGLARVALARGDTGAALLPVEGLLAHLDGGGTLDGAEAPRLIQLTCYLVLARASDARAGELLATAHSELQSKASTIADPKLRESFLTEIPENCEIVAAWAAQPAADSNQN